MSSHYTIDDDLVGYWDQRYQVWDREISLESRYNLFTAKNTWFEVRFGHLLPPRRLGARVLDYGCGNAMYSPALLRRYDHYLGLDTSPAALAIARRYFGHQANWQVELLAPGRVELPYAEATFDGVVTITVLQHQPVELRRAIIAELKRVLRPGGRYLGLEMQGQTQAFDMPPMPEADWRAAWAPLQLTLDVPAAHPEWAADNVWYGDKPNGC